MSPTNKIRNLTPEEKLLWNAILKTVAPLKKAPPASLKKEDSIFAPLPRKVSVPPSNRQASHLPSSIPVLEKHSARKIKANKIPFSATLDLHGLSQSLAYERLKTFIFKNAQEDRRYLLIITGKGKGILKQAVLNWLHEDTFRFLISALEQSHLHHGGEGALYVVLKKKRPPLN